MQLRQIKDELETLCADLQDELPSDIAERIRVIRRGVISSDQWIVKTEHLQLKILGKLWEALVLSLKDPEERDGKFLDIRWAVNQADGKLEEALRVDAAEREKGVPKPLRTRTRTAAEEDTETWVEHLQESDEFVTNADLYDSYVTWMEQESPEVEPLSSVAFGRRLGLEGFESTRASVDGTQVRGWKLEWKPS